MKEYFEARGVSEADYKDAVLSPYYIEILKDLEHNARILDFGCGFGQNLCAIKNAKWGGDKEFYLCGIDINTRAIEAVKNLGIEAICVEDIFSFKPQERFDLIITTHCLEHLPKENIIPTLQHFKEYVLKENGKIFVAVPNAQSNTGCYWAYEDFTHNTLFTAGSLVYILKMAGFKQVTIIDKDALAGNSGIKKLIKKIFLSLYKLRYSFWNKITGSATHAPSEQVFSYEIKALGQ